MRVRTIVTVLAAVAAALLPVALAGPAAAGGPTSVLLSAPALGTTASLYTTQAEYTALAEHVGASMALGSSSDAGSNPSSSKAHAGGDMVTVTWLIHDVTVWRVDRIYVDAAGGPWIASQETMGEASSIWDVPEVWHRATEPKALVQLLGSLGLVAGTSPAPDSGTSAEQPAPEAASDEAPATRTDPATQAATTDGATDGRSTTALVLTGVLGLALGVVGTVLVTAALRRRAAAGATWDSAESDIGADVLTSDGTSGAERQPAGIAGRG